MADEPGDLRGRVHALRRALHGATLQLEVARARAGDDAALREALERTRSALERAGEAATAIGEEARRRESEP